MCVLHLVLTFFYLISNFILAKPYQATVEEGGFAYFEFQFHPKVGIYSPHHHNLPLVNLVSLYTTCNHI